MKLPEEIYVVICEHDGFKDGQPIVLETSLDKPCTRRWALQRAAKLRGRYGKTRIAKLVFDECDLLVEQLESRKEYERHGYDTFDTWF